MASCDRRTWPARGGAGRLRAIDEPSGGSASSSRTTHRTRGRCGRPEAGGRRSRRRRACRVPARACRPCCRARRRAGTPPVVPAAGRRLDGPRRSDGPGAPAATRSRRAPGRRRARAPRRRSRSASRCSRSVCVPTTRRSESGRMVAALKPCSTIGRFPIGSSGNTGKPSNA